MRASHDLRSLPHPTKHRNAESSRAQAEPSPTLARTLAAALAALALLAAVPAAYAAQGDSDAPTQVESDRMEYDDLKQVNVFLGNVVLTKGTIRLLADRLVVRQDPEGFHHATATGDPARFRQRRDGPGDRWVEGHAGRIDYDGKAETVRLQDRAMLRRTQDGRALDEVHGADILYESRTEFFTVEGGDAAAGTPENPSGRVRVVIQPREERPAGSEPTPRAPLKPDDRIEIPRKGGSGR